MLRPFEGYEGNNAQVEAFSLTDVTAHLEQKFPGQQVYLFWCPDGDPKQFKQNHQVINCDENLRICAERGAGVVWLSFERSPKSSPQKQPQSIFISRQCPVVYEDTALSSLKARFVQVRERHAVEEHVLIFAVPGSGKTTTVFEAAHQVGAEYKRYRLALGGDFHLAIMELCKSKRLQDIVCDTTNEYEACKLHFLGPCTSFVDMIRVEVANLATAGVVVVHVDEAQVAMGPVLVTRGQPATSWINNEEALQSFAFPCLCDALNGLAAGFRNIIVVITGTNAFSSLVLNTGSQLKTEHIPLVGRFPIEWVMQKLVKPHFQLSPEVEGEMQVQLESLCANRRACWYFLRELWKEFGHSKHLSVQMVHSAAARGLGEWNTESRRPWDRTEQR